LVTDTHGNIVTSPSAQYAVYSDSAGGSQITGLLDRAGNPIDGSIVSPDENGWIAFTDPAETSLGVWLQPLTGEDRPRTYIMSRTIGPIVHSIVQSGGVGGGGVGASIPVGATPPATPSLNDLWYDTTEPPPVGGGEGTVTSVNGIEPVDGDVTLTAEDLGISRVYALTGGGEVDNSAAPGLVVRIS